MRQGWREMPLGGLLLLLLLLGTRTWTAADAQVASGGKNDKKFGDKCNFHKECGFEGAICSEYGKCQCSPDLPVTNHLDRCGTAVRINESCFFLEQCEALTDETDCRDGVCACRFEKQPQTKPDGKVECVVVQNNYEPPGRYIDPAMIGILVAMFLMFITICVVLRLFSRARWRENRTIFNTPNPRLMNVSLLRENKHPERRGSRSSARGPSRQPSMASLRAHSPNSQEGSRRGSRGSSNASGASNRSNKSPPHPNATATSVTTPMLESVTVEIQEPSSRHNNQ